MQAAVDILDDEIDGIGRQALIAEEDIENAVVGMHRGGVVEMPLVAFVESGAEGQQRISREHDGNRHADGPEQHAERAWADHLLAQAPGLPLDL